MPARCPWECDTQTETRQVNYAIFCRGMATLGMSNFGFVERHDVRLATLGALAERYFRDDPPTAIVKLRQFAEFLAKLIAAHHALYIGERDTFEETLRPCLLSELFPRKLLTSSSCCASSAMLPSTMQRAVVPTRLRH